MIRIGSMCSGYGGLDMAVEEVFGAKPAWFCEWDDAPSKILAHHWPDVPNLKDLTQVDWEEMSKTPDLVGTQRMYDLYCQGKSLAEIAEVEGITRQTVFTRFKRRGLDMRPRKAPLPAVAFGGRKFTLGANGYYRATEGDRAYLHREVWKSERGPIPDDWDVHHIDHDKTNNAVENLHCLSKAEHTSLHAAEGGDAKDSHRVDIVTAGYPRSVPAVQRGWTKERN